MNGHVQRRTVKYAEGWVAWCSCGIGSPAKRTPEEARKSLAKHVADPFGKGRFPR